MPMLYDNPPITTDPNPSNQQRTSCNDNDTFNYTQIHESFDSGHDSSLLRVLPDQTPSPPTPRPLTSSTPRSTPFRRISTNPFLVPPPLVLASPHPTDAQPPPDITTNSTVSPPPVPSAPPKRQRKPTSFYQAGF